MPRQDQKQKLKQVVLFVSPCTNCLTLNSEISFRKTFYPK